MRYRKSFAEQHPVILGVGILLGVGFVGAHWQAALFILAVVAVGYGLWRWGVALEKRSREQIQLRQALVAHADYEHHLWTQGNPIGFYGQYPPAI